ncbi:conserved hypothetical protein [Trichormus variabilis ATCC 29413]|uniref:Uncharacterized protein n=2 Tax=Anabaena variabilis TaxID=264691 RepID=Q3MAH4_TRIV2|nr:MULTISPECIES: hypothetical protein [Nostocaceae]ABA22012.1 conserved hypothetical protein [Trichormus variabilis ATCC 29413]MBC1215948.1 hypothetical protein [Trichormus variabilis ARAD]MBC1257354.1 hypothetical protein [Trichormus variabilis V5]MBC1267853.1 hypothetical protein [Trichormus variabilis FSR]MBC1304147.1 hypothetical protein [Trichormus variabilis N2B]
MSNQFFTEVSLEQQEIVVGASRGVQPYPVKTYHPYQPSPIKSEERKKGYPEAPKDLVKGKRPIESEESSITFNFYFHDLNVEKVYFDV